MLSFLVLSSWHLIESRASCFRLSLTISSYVVVGSLGGRHTKYEGAIVHHRIDREDKLTSVGTT
jgi:hypothetical protein